MNPVWRADYPLPFTIYHSLFLDGGNMNDEALNMSVRRFLKTVGVNSQLAIEKAVRKALEDGKLKGSESFPAAITLTVGRLGLEVKFDGEIRLE
jgi:hypothetical protein